MKKWQSTLLMVVGGISPVAVVIVVLQQFKIIGLDTALLLGLLYLLFISTHVWCRIFTKIPPSLQHEAPVDSLPCYEEAVKSEPPSYNSLYPPNSTTLDTVPNAGVTPEPLLAKSSSPPSGGSHLGNFYDGATVSLNTVHEETPDDLPILGRTNKDTRKNSRPQVVPVQTSSGNRSLAASGVDCSSEGHSSSSEGDERKQKDNMYTKMLGSIGNPIDYV